MVVPVIVHSDWEDENKDEIGGQKWNEKENIEEGDSIV